MLCPVNIVGVCVAISNRMWYHFQSSSRQLPWTWTGIHGLWFTVYQFKKVLWSCERL